MRTLPAGLQDHLDTRTTTTCWCWKVTRSDETVIGFTNHDLDLVFDGVTYKASTGLSGSELEESLGLSVDNMDVEGAISSDEITEADIASGLYDNTLVDVFLVNWSNVAQRVLLKRGRLGEVQRSEYGFSTEFRGLAADLGQPVGRIYQYKCDALLGDERCQVDIEHEDFAGEGTVTAAAGRAALAASGLSSFETNWFTNGILTFTSGDNAGRSIEVKSHILSGASATLLLWAPMPFPIEAGDEFDVVAGCNKLFATCKAKFDNAENFRGFPHMPEDEFIVRYPNRGDAGLDGGGNYNGED